MSQEAAEVFSKETFLTSLQRPPGLSSANGSNAAASSAPASEEPHA